MSDAVDAPRLEARGLSKSFGARLAVSDVSFSVDAGQVLCLLGPSGCGKSTTLRMVAGVEAQDAGDVRGGGTRRNGLPPEARGVGLMFQDFALFPHLKVAANVAYGLRDKRAAGARVSELLDRVGLAHLAGSYPHELSGGEQQRVALARALAPRPGVMLMDEPFSGLDERLRDEVRDATLAVLRDEGAAVLLVTHDPVEAMRMGDQIALMREGRIVQQGSPQELYDAPLDTAAAAFFCDINTLSGEIHAAHVETVFGMLPASGLADGTPVDIVLRPQHLAIGETGPKATVSAARFLGMYSQITCTLPDGTRLTLTRPGGALPGIGASVHLTAAKEDILIFPR